MSVSENQVLSRMLEAYRKMPFLWNRHHKQYNNKPLRAEGFDVLLRIHKIYYDENPPIAVIKKKIENLRTSYKKELRKVKAAADADEVYVPTLWYFETLNFLNGEEEFSEDAFEDARESIDNVIHSLDTEDNYIFPQLQPYSHRVSTMTMAKKRSAPSAVPTISMVSQVAPIMAPIDDYDDHEHDHNHDDVDEEDDKSKISKKLRQILTNPEPQKPPTPTSDFQALANGWGSEFAKMTSGQQLFAKKFIDDVLFEGRLGNLHKYFVTFHPMETDPLMRI